MPTSITTAFAATAASTIHLTPNDLGQRWGVSVGHLANLRSAGIGLTYLKLGASVRYRLSDVIAEEAASVVLAVA